MNDAGIITHFVLRINLFLNFFNRYFKLVIFDKTKPFFPGVFGVFSHKSILFLFPPRFFPRETSRKILRFRYFGNKYRFFLTFVSFCMTALFSLFSFRLSGTKTDVCPSRENISATFSLPTCIFSPFAPVSPPLRPSKTLSFPKKSPIFFLLGGLPMDLGGFWALCPAKAQSLHRFAMPWTTKNRPEGRFWEKNGNHLCSGLRVRALVLPSGLISPTRSRADFVMLGPTSS